MARWRRKGCSVHRHVDKRYLVIGDCGEKGGRSKFIFREDSQKWTGKPIWPVRSSFSQSTFPRLRALRKFERREESPNVLKLRERKRSNDLGIFQIFEILRTKTSMKSVLLSFTFVSFFYLILISHFSLLRVSEFPSSRTSKLPRVFVPFAIPDSTRLFELFQPRISKFPSFRNSELSISTG